MAERGGDWDASFPKGGVDQSAAYSRQPARKAPDGTYVKTTRLGVNVRVQNAADGRRGGQRMGLARWIDAQVSGGEWVVQSLDALVSIDLDPPGATVPQTSLSGRVVQVVAVSGGEVYTAIPGATSWSHATNNSGETPPLNADGVMFSAQNIQNLYFCDGINYVFYDPPTDAVELWTASTGGTLPEDSDGNRATLICTWRGRTVLSGLLLDPQNIFFSAVSDPHDFDYDPVSPSETQAVALNVSEMGLIGEPVMCLIPCTDDVLVVGCTNSIRAIRGDPRSGGQIDLVSDQIGMAWGQPYAKAADGTIYFFSNRAGVFRMNPNTLAPPVKVSGAIDQIMTAINTGENHVRMAWDDAFDTLQVFVTPVEEPGETRHFAYETKTGAWWVDELAHVDFDPLACCVLDGNEPGDRVVLVGSWDGYVRTFSPTAEDDDGRPINSGVWVGPIVTDTMDEVCLLELQAVLGETSGDVSWAAHAGRTAQEAFESEAAVEGTWSAGMSDAEHVRVAGHAVYVHVTATNPWQMEQVRGRVAALGPYRRRQKG